MTPRPCGHCGALTIDRQLCPTCETGLDRVLKSVPVVLDELDTTLARLGRHPAAGATTDTSPVIDESVSVVAAGIRGACIGWAAQLGYTGPRPWLWLWQETETIATRYEHAATLYRDLDRRTAAAWRKVDRPDAKWYAGVCGARVIGPDGVETDCPRVLWADLEQDHIRCPTCRTQWTVADRREHLIAHAGDYVGTVAQVASVLTLVTRQRISRSRIGNWITRGRLIPQPRASDTDPYRVRVRDALAAVNTPETGDDPRRPEETPSTERNPA